MDEWNIKVINKQCPYRYYPKESEIKDIPCCKLTNATVMQKCDCNSCGLRVR